MPSENLICELGETRNPFRIKRVPLLGQLYKYWFDNNSNKRRRIWTKLARFAFITLKRRAMNSTGTFYFQDIPVSFNASNTQFSSIYLQKYASGFEAEVGALLDFLVPEKGVFLDVGANFGYFSLFVAAREDFSGEIHAFEPHPESYADLVSTVRQTQLESVINCHAIAAYDETTERTVNVTDVRNGSFSVTDSTPPNKNSVRICMAPLDELGIKKVDVIKLDVEGSEYRALKGSLNLLRQDKPHIIFESISYTSDPAQTIQPFALLREAGYVFFHAGWLKPIESIGNFVVLDEEKVLDTQKGHLVLSPILEEQRFLFCERLNILAVHADKLPSLADRCVPGGKWRTSAT